MFICVLVILQNAKLSEGRAVYCHIIYNITNITITYIVYVRTYILYVHTNNCHITLLVLTWFIPTTTRLDPTWEPIV